MVTSVQFADDVQNDEDRTAKNMSLRNANKMPLRNQPLTSCRYAHKQYNDVNNHVKNHVNMA